MFHPESEAVKERIQQYLQSWGLKAFHDEASYYDWQRSCLTPQQLNTLTSLIERRRGENYTDADLEFYDFLAQPSLLPVLYSQRYDYFVKVGTEVCQKIPGAGRVLDFGCGVGLLTTFFAQEFRQVEFVGIDRSSGSIAIAQESAEKRRVKNVSYQVVHIPQDPVSGTYDLILSTQALFQSETHPGLPSRSWRTFQREEDLSKQIALEETTGLIPRLNKLMESLAPDGRMVLYEKAGHLGRQVLFQRALARRGLVPIGDPVPLFYSSIDEHVCDGPLYEVKRADQGAPFLWNEAPFRQLGETLYRSVGETAVMCGPEFTRDNRILEGSGRSVRWGEWRLILAVWNDALLCAYLEGNAKLAALLAGGIQERPLMMNFCEQCIRSKGQEADRLITDMWGHLLDDLPKEEPPAYENHSPFAQDIFFALPFKNVEKEKNWEAEQGRAMHLEYGTTLGFCYLYWANTFDQRQLVLVHGSRRAVLRDYFEESVLEMNREMKT